MCWHYNKQELQLFNLQVVSLGLVHDIRLGLWLLRTFNCNCSYGFSSVLWNLGSMTHSNENATAMSIYCHEDTLNIPSHHLFIYFIQDILYFKVDLMTCPTSPIVLLPARVLWAILLVSWPHFSINISAVHRKLTIRDWLLLRLRGVVL